MNIEIPGLLIINGEQGSGKSSLIKYLMRMNKRKFDYGIVFTNTSFDRDDKASFNYIPKGFVHSEFSEDILIALMNKQKDLIKNRIKKEAFVILDDCLDRDMFNSKWFQRLATQLRHYHITAIISTQYPNALPPKYRTNCMSTVIFRTNTNVALKALWESYGQYYKFNEFRELVMKSTGNYQFLYYNKKESDPTKQYQCMKAPSVIKPFKMKYKLTVK